MNCANHPDRERAAFCQNCGKPICSECIRTLGTSTYCEPCYAARSAASAPPGATYPPGATTYPGQVREPSPGLAAILGLIPGVGAMYNEQYAKGIIHLMVFAVLISLSHDVDIFGIFVAGWYFYMVIEAYQTARARRDGTPLPNPFGLNDVAERLGFAKAPHPAGGYPPYTPPAAAPPVDQPFASSQASVPPQGTYHAQTYAPPASAWGAAQEYSPPVPPVAPVTPIAPADLQAPYYRRFPTGAIWLIVLGVVFLLGNIGLFHVVRMRYIAPVLLIGFGVWMFVHKMLLTGPGLENDGSPYYRWRLSRALRGSVWMVFIGFIWLLDSLRILSWARSWPLLLIGAGVMLFVNRVIHPEYPVGAAPVAPAPPAPPSTEIARTGAAAEPPDGEQGR